MLPLFFYALILKLHHFDLPGLFGSGCLHFKTLLLSALFKLTTLLLGLALFFLKLLPLTCEHLLLSSLNLLYFPLFFEPFLLVFHLFLVILLLKPRASLCILGIHFSLFAVYFPLLGLKDGLSLALEFFLLALLLFFSLLCFKEALFFC